MGTGPLTHSLTILLSEWEVERKQQTMTDSIRVIRISDTALVTLHDVDPFDYTHGIHDLLGGYMEVVRLRSPFGSDPFDGLIGLVDEDGLGKHLPVNPLSQILFGQLTVGPIVIVRAKDADFVSLRESDWHLVRDNLPFVITLEF